MQRTRVVALAATALTATLLAAPAAYGGAPPTISAAPTSGPIGTMVTVAGTGCWGGVAEVIFGDLGADEWYTLVDAVPAVDGDWSSQFPVPDVDPDGDWSVSAICWYPSPEQTPYDYDLVPFDVLADGTVLPTEPPADPADPAPAPAGEPAAAPAAAPVPGRPSYAG